MGKDGEKSDEIRLINVKARRGMFVGGQAKERDGWLDGWMDGPCRSRLSAVTS